MTFGAKKVYGYVDKCISSDTHFHFSTPWQHSSQWTSSALGSLSTSATRIVRIQIRKEYDSISRLKEESTDHVATRKINKALFSLYMACRFETSVCHHYSFSESYSINHIEIPVQCHLYIARVLEFPRWFLHLCVTPNLVTHDYFTPNKNPVSGTHCSLALNTLLSRLEPIIHVSILHGQPWLEYLLLGTWLFLWYNQGFREQGNLRKLVTVICTPLW